MKYLAVIEETGEVTLCSEVDAFDDYVFADMVVIPTRRIIEVREVEIDG